MISPKLILCLILAMTTSALAQDVPLPSEKKIKYSPYAGQHFPNRVYFGDTHLHTSWSTDTGMIGNKLDPEEAYRFALGEEVATSCGQCARLIRPLDFLLLSDPAENLGLAPMIAESNPEFLKSDWGGYTVIIVRRGSQEVRLAELL